ncbi:MAG TPA: hypothetical protein VNU25_01555 [Candidatus Paceibacterota bacterium]|nr:hypothetical protein [Candidatus Paceibacterota bacterium]
MQIQELADLGTSNQLAASNDMGLLSEALKSIIENTDCWEYAHSAIVYGGSGSVRLFLQEPIDGSISLPAPMRPLALAHELIRFSETEARYPENPGHGRTKGWIIRSVQINGSPAAIAEAAWV